MHARTAGGFEQIEDSFAQIEAIEESGQRAQVDPAGSQPHAVRRDARELGEQHANRLRAWRHRGVRAQQLLDGEVIAQRVGQRREVVHPLDDGGRLRPEQIFGALLDARVEVTDLGRRFGHRLAVDLGDDLQDAVRRWMLRPHREHHAISALLDDVERDRLGSARDGHRSFPSGAACPSMARRTSAICFCSAAAVRPDAGVPAATFDFSANDGRGVRSRATPRSG
jgi:hypothetical protein